MQMSVWYITQATPRYRRRIQ